MEVPFSLLVKSLIKSDFEMTLQLFELPEILLQLTVPFNNYGNLVDNFYYIIYYITITWIKVI